MFSRFGTVPACDGRTDRLHDYSIYCASIASRGKNLLTIYFEAMTFFHPISVGHIYPRLSFGYMPNDDDCYYLPHQR